MSFQISFFVFFGQIPRRRIAGSYERSSLNILRTLHTVFYSGHIHLIGICDEWMDLESIMLSEISLVEKDKNHMISLMWGTKQKK